MDIEVKRGLSSSIKRNERLILRRWLDKGVLKPDPYTDGFDSQTSLMTFSMF